MNFIANESKEKLRGGYYTPAHIARYLARWVQSFGAQRVLEPSCGDGQFLEALAAEACAGVTHVTALELLPEEAAKARQRARRSDSLKTQVICDDFLGWSLKQLAIPHRFD